MIIFIVTVISSAITFSFTKSYPQHIVSQTQFLSLSPSGAVAFIQDSVSVGIAFCLFDNCSIQGRQGGGIYLKSTQIECILSKVCGSRCQTLSQGNSFDYGQFLYLEISDATNVHNLNLSTAHRCPQAVGRNHGAFTFWGGGNFVGEGLSSPSNSGHRGAAFVLSHTKTFTISSSHFVSNTALELGVLDCDAGAASFERCHVSDSHGSFPLLSTYGAVDVRFLSCVFANNEVNELPSSGSVQTVECAMTSGAFSPSPSRIRNEVCEGFDFVGSSHCTSRACFHQKLFLLSLFWLFK
jgi:hypothetical protein